MSKYKREITPAIIDEIKAESRAGISIERISARIWIKYGFRVYMDDLREWTRQVYLPPVRERKTVRFTLATDADRGDDPARVNLWAFLCPPGAAYPWLVIRSRFVKDGKRAYRVIPESREPFTMWASSFDDWCDQMLGIGICIIAAEQANMFTMPEAGQQAGRLAA